MSAINIDNALILLHYLTLFQCKRAFLNNGPEQTRTEMGKTQNQLYE